MTTTLQLTHGLRRNLTRWIAPLHFEGDKSDEKKLLIFYTFHVLNARLVQRFERGWNVMTCIVFQRPLIEYLTCSLLLGGSQQIWWMTRIDRLTVHHFLEPSSHYQCRVPLNMVCGRKYKFAMKTARSASAFIPASKLIIW